MSSHRPSCTIPYRRHLANFIVIALIAASLFISPRASAQGTMGMLPGPISTVELDGYAQRLRVSPQQRRAMDAIHDQYKQEFRTLREGDIAAFMKQMREMEGDSMPKRKAIEEFVSQMESLGRKISAVDNRFFDQLQTTLTEDQLMMMPRVRLARQRGRMENMQMMWMAGEKPADLSEIVFGMEFSEADRATAIDILGPYEVHLTADMEKMYAGTLKTITGIYDALEKLGFSESQLEDPEQMEKISEAMQQVWMDMMAENAKLVRGVTDLNDRTMRSIAAAVAPDSSRAFRNRYNRQVYAEASFAMYIHDYVFAPALKRDDLTPPQREAIIAARDEMQRSLDAVLDHAIAAIQEWRGSVSAFNYDQEKAEAYQKKLVELRADADRARTTANASMEAALGKELLDKIGRLKASQEEPQDEMAMDDDIGVGPDGEVEATADEGDDGDDVINGIDQFVPPAISPIDLVEYGDRLGLADEQRTVLAELHERYMASFAALGESEFAALQKVTTSMWQWDEKTQTSSGPTTEKVTEAYRLRQAALDAVRKVDESFFSEVEIALVSPERAKDLARIKLSRDRSNYNRTSYYYENNEGSLDVSRMVIRRKALIPPGEWNAIDETLHAYEQESLPLFKVRFAAAMEVQKAQELWQAEFTRAQAEGNQNNFQNGQRYMVMMREPQTALAEASESLSALNRKTVDAIVASLAGEAGHSMRSEYNRRAFPNVYGDEGSMERAIVRARALPDLSSEQSQQIGDLAAEYHPAYAAICEEMIKSTSMRSNMFATIDEDNAEEWQKREETQAKLRFDRSELNARAGGRLKSILTEDQLKRIGGLPTVERPTEFDF